MTYTQIRRGPMGGDHYTQIHNGVFRDATLTPNAKAIFGWISTHQQNWSTSLAGIAVGVGIGQAAAKKAVQMLKARHYLVYGQERRANGTRGQAWYFLTDLPAQLAEIGITDEDTVAATVQRALIRWQTENARSEPVGQICTPGEGLASSQVGTGGTKTDPPVEPLAAARRTKKTKEPPEEQNQEDEDLKQCAAAASPSTWPLTDEDQNRDRVCDPSPRQRDEGSHTQQDPGDAWGQPAGEPHRVTQAAIMALAPDHRADYVHGERVFRVVSLIDSALGGLDGNELNAVGSMAERGHHWQKILRAICNQRGYDKSLTQSLINWMRGRPAA